jgi:hypothetical protein
VFEHYALDTKLDVKPSGDAFETRANVIKAIQGHILAKAVYGGLFRRPQQSPGMDGDDSPNGRVKT